MTSRRHKLPILAAIALCSAALLSTPLAAAKSQSAPDWAVAADWVACPVSFVVAGAAVNGVS